MKRTRMMILALSLMPTFALAQMQGEPPSRPAAPTQMPTCAPLTMPLQIADESKLKLLLQKRQDLYTPAEQQIVMDFRKDYAMALQSQQIVQQSAFCTDDKAKVTPCLSYCADRTPQERAEARYIVNGAHSRYSEMDIKQAAAVSAKLNEKWAPWITQQGQK